MEGSESTDRIEPRVIGDMVRALFVVANVLLAVLLVAWSVAALAFALNPPGDAPDTVVPRVGFDDFAIISYAAFVAVIGAVYAVRLWLRGSWHVVTVAVATLIGMVPFVWLLAMQNWQY